MAMYHLVLQLCGQLCAMGSLGKSTAPKRLALVGEGASRFSFAHEGIVHCFSFLSSLFHLESIADTGGECALELIVSDARGARCPALFSKCF